MLNEHPPRKGASSELDRLHVGKMVEGRRGGRQVRDAEGEKERENGESNGKYNGNNDNNAINQRIHVSSLGDEDFTPPDNLVTRALITWVPGIYQPFPCNLPKTLPDPPPTDYSTTLP